MLAPGPAAEVVLRGRLPVVTTEQGGSAPALGLPGLPRLTMWVVSHAAGGRRRAEKAEGGSCGSRRGAAEARGGVVRAGGPGALPRGPATAKPRPLHAHAGSFMAAMFLQCQLSATGTCRPGCRQLPATAALCMQRWRGCMLQTSPACHALLASFEIDDHETQRRGELYCAVLCRRWRPSRRASSTASHSSSARQVPHANPGAVHNSVCAASHAPKSLVQAQAPPTRRA